MNSKVRKVPLSIPGMGMVKLTRLVVSAILMLGICLSAAVPVTPVLSASPNLHSGKQLQAEEDVCASPVISSNTTWTTGNVYKADCVVTVSAGVTLTVQAGAVVQFGGSGRGLRVLGTLNVIGSAGNPAVFTSLNDSSANSWYGIVLYENSSANLDYAQIRYAGSGVCTGGYEDTTYNSCYNRAQLDVRKADLTLNHSEIRDGHMDGVVLDTPGRTPSIQNTIISNNKNGNTTDKIGYAIYQSTINMQPTYANLTLSGNDRDQVVIWTSDLSQNVTLGGAPIGFDCGSSGCPVNILSPWTLTVQAGSILDMSTISSELIVQSGGTLLIQGTEAAPVSIIKGGVEVQFGGVADLAYCDVGGGDSVYYGLEISSDNVIVSNCVFHNFYLDGINVYAPTSKSLHMNMSNVDVMNNTRNGIIIGTSSGASASVSLVGGTVSGYGINGITVGGNPSSLTLKDVIISGNGLKGTDGSNRNGLYATTNNVSLSLENVQFNNNVNEAAYWTCNGSISAKNLSASGNARNALVLAGCGISTGREWDLADIGIPAIVTSWIDVNSGGILSITPGSKLGFTSEMNLQVQPNGALYALGTADKPIVFTRAYDTQSGSTAWYGLENYKGTMILRHCEVSYANYRSDYGGRGVGIKLGGSTDIPTNTIIQNCKIHHNEIGIQKWDVIQPTTVVLYNEIYNNPTFGIAWASGDVINAFHNYWGDPSGPTHSSNPGGIGDPVSDNVNFNPFLTAPPEDEKLVGDMWVSSGGPNLISPGEVNDYAIQYLNLTADPIYGAVAVIQLPLAGKYLSSTEGGTYWPGRHQVFWVLGDIAPGAKGMLTARVRFDWGLPGSYQDGSFTMLSGSNYKTEQINLAEYISYDPDEIANIVPSNQAAFDGWCAGNASLQALYNTAVAEGFAFIEASETNFEGGRVVKTALMRTPDKKLARMLNLSGSEALAITTNGSTFFKIEGLGGGQLTDLLTLERSTWGAWAEAATTSSIQAECNYARCMRNCTFKTMTIEVMKDTAKDVGIWLLSLPATGGLLGSALLVYEAVSKVVDVYSCHDSCSVHPETGCCNPGQVLWSPSFIGGSSRCEKYECGYWNSFPAAPNIIEACPTGSRCVAGNDGYGGCKPCTEDSGLNSLMLGPQLTIASPCADNTINAGLPKCSDLGIRVAKDPNALYGPDGDVLPTDTMNYRITYENEGAGEAFGVYILNKLPDQLDESTLVINDGGVYMPGERQIFWYVGELGPKGDATSEGEVTYSAKLKPGLAAGTAVVNQAVVYFPSVPEETPTNTYTNLVYPLVATPQVLATDYMTPIDIVLTGRPTGSLSFEVESSPMGGTLSGTAPNLTYTPVENFSGVDYFTFTASVGGQTSQPAQVTINVSTTGDAAKPIVQWVVPESGQTGVAASGSAIYSVVEGGVYAPVIAAKFNEKLQEGSITPSSVVVTGPGGAVVPSKAIFDPGTNQLNIQLLTALQSETLYTVTLSTAIKDLAGNGMATNYSWQFTTAKVVVGGSQIFLPMIKR